MDISFPASSLVLSDMVPKDVQGVAASLVNTIVNYSISIGLGIAGTAEREVRVRGGSELQGFRAAFYTAVGLSCGAFVVALSFAVYTQAKGEIITAKTVAEKAGNGDTSGIGDEPIEASTEP